MTSSPPGEPSDAAPPDWTPPPGQSGAPQQPPPYGYPQPPPGYYQGYPPGYPVSRGTNGMAIASMVLGIIWIYWIGSVLALVFGYIARNQIRQTGQGGDGMAIAGIVLGWVGMAALAFVLIFLVAVSN